MSPRGKWGVALGYAVSPLAQTIYQAAHDPWFTHPVIIQRNATGWIWKI